jgi:hypothetical protein
MLVPQLLPTRPHATPTTHRKASGRSAAHHGPQHDAGTSHAAATHHPGASHAGSAHHADAEATAFDLALLARQQTFDLTVKQRAEDEREMNVLRDMAMAQLKKDDENMKKWIALI